MIRCPSCKTSFNEPIPCPICNTPLNETNDASLNHCEKCDRFFTLEETD